MFSYRTPGVYFEWLDRLRHITRVRTDVAGFVGIATRGPLHRAVKLASWQQYVSVFGGIASQPQGFLAYAVRGFFDNGGAECWVVRVADPAQAAPAVFEVSPEWGFVASSPGTWGRQLRLEMRRVGGNQFNLTVSLPQGNAVITRKWLSLPLDDIETLRKRIEEGELELRRAETDAESKLQVEDKRRLARLIDVMPAPGDAAQPGSSMAAFPGNGLELRGNFVGGHDGLATLTTAHMSGARQLHDVRWGLSVLEHIDEISIVAMPDIMPMWRAPVPEKRPEVICDLQPTGDAWPIVEPVEVEYAPAFDEDQTQQLQLDLIQHCTQQRDRVAILDSRPVDKLPQAVIEWRSRFDTSYAALYYPWIRVPRPDGGLITVPPSGYVAGIYARGDIEIGVHKPPANFAMEDVKDVAYAIDEIIHGVLNEKQVNVLRAYPGRGIRIGGAVTLSSDTLVRYINVRRLLLMIAESIDENTQWTVFEPNNPELWAEIARSARTFLDGIWRAGMLDGATAEEAYSVRCDATTNPPEDTERGLLQCEIGVLPPYPAEFVIVRIGKTDGGTDIREARA